MPARSKYRVVNAQFMRISTMNSNGKTSVISGTFFRYALSNRQKPADKGGDGNVAEMEKEQFSKLIRACSPNMYRLAAGILQNRQDAEDAVGEAILRAYENIGKLKNTEKFKAWIMQITANEARKIYNQRKRTFPSEYLEELLPLFEDEHHELWDIVMKLDVVFREVIILFYYEQLSIREIGQVLKVKEGTVKSRLSRGKRQLREMLDKQDGNAW